MICLPSPIVLKYRLIRWRNELLGHPVDCTLYMYTVIGYEYRTNPAHAVVVIGWWVRLRLQADRKNAKIPWYGCLTNSAHVITNYNTLAWRWWSGFTITRLRTVWQQHFLSTLCKCVFASDLMKLFLWEVVFPCWGQTLQVDIHCEEPLLQPCGNLQGHPTTIFEKHLFGIRFEI